MHINRGNERKKREIEEARRGGKVIGAGRKFSCSFSLEILDLPIPSVAVSPKSPSEHPRLWARSRRRRNGNEKKKKRQGRVLTRRCLEFHHRAISNLTTICDCCYAHHFVRVRQVRRERPRVLPNHGAPPRDRLKVVHRLEGHVPVDEDPVHYDHRCRLGHRFSQLPLTLVRLTKKTTTRERHVEGGAGVPGGRGG